MDPYYSDGLVTLYHGSNVDVLPQLAGAGVDLVFTSPPYNLGTNPGGSFGHWQDGGTRGGMGKWKPGESTAAVIDYLDHDDALRARPRPGKCCPDCRHYHYPPPPGAQLLLLARPLPTTAGRWRSVTSAGRWMPWQQTLSLATLQAAAAARADGEAWLVAPDLSYAHLERAAGGRVVLNPYTGWAVPAANTISSSQPEGATP